MPTSSPGSRSVRKAKATRPRSTRRCATTCGGTRGRERPAKVLAMNSDAPVIVIGAGIVGTATARALQRSGHAVTLVDSAEPGKATSYGNAGFIAIDHVLPLARPSTLKRVPQMLMDRNGPLTVHPPSIPSLLPWMLRFARAAYSATEVRKGVDSFGPLMAEANVAWKAEIQ